MIRNKGKTYGDQGRLVLGNNLLTTNDGKFKKQTHPNTQRIPSIGYEWNRTLYGDTLPSKKAY